VRDGYLPVMGELLACLYLGMIIDELWKMKGGDVVKRSYQVSWGGCTIPATRQDAVVEQATEQKVKTKHGTIPLVGAVNREVVGQLQ
jgi:hypothetical protein